MDSDDEKELHRLTEMLRAIDSELPLTSDLREALQKAGIALHLSFLNRLRTEVEERHEAIGDPLSEAQLKHLSDLEI